MVHNRAIEEISSGVANEFQYGESYSKVVSNSGGGGLSLGISLGPVNLGLGGGGSSSKTYATSRSSSAGGRSVTAESVQNIRDKTQQLASSVRSRRASVVKEASQNESESLQTRIITNYNHSHALSIQYFEVVQIYRVLNRLINTEWCIFIPFKPLDFTKQHIVKRYHRILAQAALQLQDQYAYQLLNNPLGDAELKLSLSLSPFARYVDAQGVKINAEGGIEGDGSKGFWRIPQRAYFRGISFTLSLPGSMSIRRRSEPEDPNAYVEIEEVWLTTVHSGERIKLHLDGVWKLDTETLDIPIEVIDAIYFKIKQGTVRNSTRIWMDLEVDGKGYRITSEGHIPTTGSNEVRLLQFNHPEYSIDLGQILNEERIYYSQAIWNNMDADTIAMMLAYYQVEGVRLIEHIDPHPVGTYGNYVAFRFDYAPPKELVKGQKPVKPEFLALWEKWQHENIQKDLLEEIQVPVPTGGVFAESVLGRFNGSEKIDLTRFWNWQDSPIPHLSMLTEISSLQSGSRYQNDNVETGKFDQGLVNIVNPSALPDPTGMNNLMTVLAAANLFRDMSGLSGTQDVVKSGIASSTEMIKAFMANPSYTGGLMNEAKKSDAKDSKQNAAQQQKILNNASGTPTDSKDTPSDSSPSPSDDDDPSPERDSLYEELAKKIQLIWEGDEYLLVTDPEKWNRYAGTPTSPLLDEEFWGKINQVANAALESFKREIIISGISAKNSLTSSLANALSKITSSSFTQEAKANLFDLVVGQVLTVPEDTINIPLNCNCILACRLHLLLNYGIIPLENKLIAEFDNSAKKYRKNLSGSFYGYMKNEFNISIGSLTSMGRLLNDNSTYSDLYNSGILSKINTKFNPKKITERQFVEASGRKKVFDDLFSKVESFDVILVNCLVQLIRYPVDSNRIIENGFAIYDASELSGIPHMITLYKNPFSKNIMALDPFVDGIRIPHKIEAKLERDKDDLMAHPVIPKIKFSQQLTKYSDQKILAISDQTLFDSYRFLVNVRPNRNSLFKEVRERYYYLDIK
ncbi:MAG: hypothetical protein KF690_06955 [Bacteroidetes bacterium]|nr:hypothetical protein [Bacteroidota bacterium]